jgi:sugar O-acyltransferase (sialic acid O-acetyltransferase NeuD family)
MNPLLLVGGGGHAHACIDVIEAESAFTIHGIAEHTEEMHAPVLGYNVIGSDADLARPRVTAPSALITVGQVRTPDARVALYELLVGLGAILPVIISPISCVSEHSSIGESTIVLHEAIINALASVGRNRFINWQSMIGRDAGIGHHCHISTGARVNGGVIIGSGTFIGGGVVLRETVRIGANCVVGAGAIVLHDLPDATRYIGMP